MKKLLAAIVIFIIAILACVSSSAYAAKKDIMAKKDIVAPSITNIYPKNKEKDVMVESTIIIRFDEIIQKGKTITKIGLTDSASKNVAFTCEMKDNVLMIIPKEKLKFNTEYKLTIPAGTVKDSIGLALAKQYLLSFTTEKSLYTDQSDIGIISGDSEEDDTSDIEDPAANTDTVNLNLELEAYVADADFSEADEVKAITALKKAGIYVRNISSEITVSQTYDVILESVTNTSSSFERYLKEISGYDDPYDIMALLLSIPSVIAEDLSRSEAELIKFNSINKGATVSIVEHVSDPEEEAADAMDTTDEVSDQASGEVSDTEASGTKDVVIVSISGGLYPVMKILKDKLEISLYEAYISVDETPVTITDVSPEVARSLKFSLERAGAVVEILDHEEE